MAITPLCIRRRRVSRRNNLPDCDMGHVASYLCAAKLQKTYQTTKDIAQKNFP